MGAQGVDHGDQALREVSAEPHITILPAHDRDAWRRAFGAPNRCGQPVARVIENRRD